MGFSSSSSRIIRICTISTTRCSRKYNQAVQNRNAQIAEQEAAQIEKQLEFDLARFDQKFQQLQGQTNVAIAKSGADISGTGLRILRSNAQQAEIEKNIMDYNAKNWSGKKI
jgi:hypothetical protein